MDSTSVDSDAATPSKVLWQTCVWILISLAANAMAQPCGRIFGLSSRYRVYLRSSPLICLADSISIVLNILICSIHFKISPVKASRILIAKRFDEEDLEDGLAKTIWLRWLFFVLGALPQAVKLGSFHGIPWTQFLGFSYLASFVIVENLIFIASRRNMQVTLNPTNDPTTSSYEDVQLLLYFADMFLVVLSCVVTFCIGALTAVFVFYTFDLGLLALMERNFDSYVLTSLSICFFPVGIVGILVLFWYNCLSHRKVKRWIRRHIHTNLGVNLIVVFPGENAGEFDVDLIAVGCLVFFFLHLLSGIFLYWNSFESEDT